MSRLPQINPEGLASLIYTALSPLLGQEATPRSLATRARHVAQVIISIIPGVDDDTFYEVINDIITEEISLEDEELPPALPRHPGLVQGIHPDLYGDVPPAPAGVMVHDAVLVDPVKAERAELVEALRRHSAPSELAGTDAAIGYDIAICNIAEFIKGRGL